MAILKRVTEGTVKLGKPKYIRLDCSRDFLRLLQTVPRIGTIMDRPTLMHDWVHPIERKKFQIENFKAHAKLAYHYQLDDHNHPTGYLKVAAILVLLDGGLSYEPLIRIDVSRYYLRKKFVVTSMKRMRMSKKWLFEK